MNAMTYCAVIDYGSGNLRSVSRALAYAAETVRPDIEIRVTADAAMVRGAERIVLPGVGAFADCKHGLEKLPGMIAAIEERSHSGGTPFLGICVGMQLLADVGREHAQTLGGTPGLQWIPGVVKDLPAQAGLKIPHMGWDKVRCLRPHPVLDALDGQYVYYAHSYGLEAERPESVLAITDYGQPFAAAVGQGSILGVQFHPEKSQKAGLELLGRFLRWMPGRD